MTDPEVMEVALRAIGHSGRRAMLRQAAGHERTSTELADAAGLSRSAASQHLKVLRDAGLVHVRIDATRRLYRADVATMASLRAFSTTSSLSWTAPADGHATVRVPYRDARLPA